MTSLSPVHQAARSLWSKSPKKNADDSAGAKLPVLNHLLDVAACAAEILELEPPHTRNLFRRDLGLPEDQALPWLYALIALHDLGKVSPAFQVLWPEGREAVDPALLFAPDLREPFTPHGVVTEALLPGFLTGLGWPGAVARAVADAVGCHHGFRIDKRELNQPESQTGDVRWEQVRMEHARLVTLGTGAAWEAVPSVPSLSPAAFMRLAGLTSFADWLGSSFPLPTQTDFSAYDDPVGYFARARGRARATLAQIHWPVFAPLRAVLPSLPEAFAYLSADFQPRPLQSALAQALSEVDGPALVLVEAPMGEGKTEAAFYAHLQLQAAARHRGLYVALPTQATGNAMYRRFRDFLQAQGRATPPDLQLAHGGTLLSEDFQAVVAQTAVQHARNAANDPAEQDGRRAGDSSVRAEEWFTQRKRALLSEYGVGTVDQALLGVLGVGHQFVRLWGLGNRVVVLDEVHAYDTYTSELIAALVAWLRALGSSVVIMSATLPDESRRHLLRAWGAEEAPSAPYPRLTVAPAAGKVQVRHIPAVDEAGHRSREQQHLQVQALGSAVHEVAQQAVNLTAGGGCAAVIVNTVGRAQQVQQAVMAELARQNITARTCAKSYQRGPQEVSVLLYHARYPADERLGREGRVLRYLGKEPESVRPERFILIATQVAEQSLDFDADVMITDLAPMDLMLQRAGRLHRHAHNQGRRHGHEDAVLYVAGLNEWPDRSLEQEFWGRVYAPALLYRSWLALTRRPGQSLTLPDDLDELVQTVYRAEFETAGLTDEQRAQLTAADADLHTQRGNQAAGGMFAHIGRPDDFWQTPLHRQDEPDTESVNDDGAAVGAETADFPRTRLGEQGVRIIPVEQKDGTWWVVPTALPAKGQKPEALRTQFQKLEKDKTGQAHALKIYRRSLSVSRWELVRFAAREWEKTGQALGTDRKGWKAHPLLQDVVPVAFRDGQAEVGGLRIRLDRELGLVFEA
ncbi:CRISPR-associated helicase Cas3' [Deinococcus sp. HMF7604]|uniref:CRISPR-associated helicase Cas3' n=1 Tax=Deinococcus betulae TaxID=2873312 RepID=UPI001CCFB1E5|nr:CRISPR-associated helicase Cas3' [Deinococcus betulae]MBZ9751891.1 CRISPR-associated helicase Cas3' [Deinococcus betulae]